MSFRTDLKEYLNNKLGLLVGTRIYANYAPTKAVLPYITYSTVSETSYQNIARSSDLGKQTIQFNCWADNPNTAIEIGDKLRMEFDSFHGDMINTKIYGAFIQGMLDDEEDADDGSQVKYYKRIVDIDFNYHRLSR